MAYKTITYQVRFDGITPSGRQRIGMQGHHNMVRLEFEVDPALRAALESGASKRVFFRFEIYNGTGEVFRTSSEDVMENYEDYVIYYTLQERDTRYGGIVKVVLVLTVVDGTDTVMESYSFPALLQVESLPEGVASDGKNRVSYSELELKALEASVAALEVKQAYDSGKLKGEQGEPGEATPEFIAMVERAKENAQKTESARAALENGTVWIFDGGDADGAVDLDGDGEPDANTAGIKIVVDNEMSDESENIVKNRVIKRYVDDSINNVDNVMSDESENTVKNKVIKEYIDNLINDAKKQAKLDAHPVGSYYWSSQPDSPATLFGGTWEQVQGKFILAAGTYTDKNGEERTFAAGENDTGEYRHTLEVDEMPSHSHSDLMSSAVNTSAGATLSYEDVEFSGQLLRVNNNTYTTKVSSDIGNSQPHNNIPPYEVAYCWKRIS
ncbi:MAG: hypothetical protein J6C27_00855 [Clostridia bacterium]|nr:hypothetical protein [Clostridia bacterium]